MLRKVLIWIVEAHRGVWMIDPSACLTRLYGRDGYHPNELAVDGMGEDLRGRQGR